MSLRKRFVSCDKLQVNMKLLERVLMLMNNKSARYFFLQIDNSVGRNITKRTVRSEKISRSKFGGH